MATKRKGRPKRPDVVEIMTVAHMPIVRPDGTVREDSDTRPMFTQQVEEVPVVMDGRQMTMRQITWFVRRPEPKKPEGSQRNKVDWLYKLLYLPWLGWFFRLKWPKRFILRFTKYHPPHSDRLIVRRLLRKIKPTTVIFINCHQQDGEFIDDIWDFVAMMERWFGHRVDPDTDEYLLAVIAERVEEVDVRRPVSDESLIMRVPILVLSDKRKKERERMPAAKWLHRHLRAKRHNRRRRKSRRANGNGAGQRRAPQRQPSSEPKAANQRS